MRISDDRYNRDIRRHTLAMRLIRHQARTETIKQWTGLSAFRIRALVHSYSDQPGPSSITRHRGAAPRKVSIFYKSPQHEYQSLALAICFELEGLIPIDLVPDAARTFPGIETGERLCNAFDAFVRGFPHPHIELEHAILLALALASGAELMLDQCDHCGGLSITNRLEQRERLCIFCRLDTHTRERRGFEP